MDFCRDAGWAVEKVTWYSHGRHHDFLGCVDLIVCSTEATTATGPAPEILFVQTTSGNNHAARRQKMLDASLDLRPWARAGAIFEIWSWALRGPRGKRKIWTLRRERLEI